jgi:hypothetical protein
MAFMGTAGFAQVSGPAAAGRLVVVRGVDAERLAAKFLTAGAERIVADRTQSVVVVQLRAGDSDSIMHRVGALPSVVETLDLDSEDEFLNRAQRLLGGAPLDRPGVGIVSWSTVTLSPDLIRIGSQSAPLQAATASLNPPISDDFEGPLNVTNGGKWNILVNDLTSGYYWGRTSCDHISGQYCADAIRDGTRGATVSCTYSYPFIYKSVLELADTVTLPAGTNAWLNFGFKGQAFNSTYNYHFYGVYISLDRLTGVGYTWRGDWSASWNMQSLDLTAWATLGDLRQHGPFWVWFFLDAKGSYTNEGFGFRIDDFSINTSGGTLLSRWIPAVIHKDVPSRNAWWRSDVAVLNRSSQGANVTLKMHAPAGIQTKTVQVGAHGQTLLTDLAAQLGIMADSGALEVVSDQDVVVSGRTYSQVDPTHTYGQDYEGEDPLALLGQGQSAWLPQLTQNAYYRTNIGITNTGASTANVTVTLYDSTGNPAGWSDTRDYTPGQFYQHDQPFLQTPAHAIDSGYAVIRVNSGSGVVAWASVIDQNTGDATTIRMKR